MQSHTARPDATAEARRSARPRPSAAARRCGRGNRRRPSPSRRPRSGSKPRTIAVEARREDHGAVGDAQADEVATSGHPRSVVTVRYSTLPSGDSRSGRQDARPSAGSNGQYGARRGIDRRQARARHAVDRRERATDVQRAAVAARSASRSTLPPDALSAHGYRRPVGRAQRGHAGSRHAVDRRERAARGRASASSRDEHRAPPPVSVCRQRNVPSGATARSRRASARRTSTRSRPRPARRRRPPVIDSARGRLGPRRRRARSRRASRSGGGCASRASVRSSTNTAAPSRGHREERRPRTRSCRPAPSRAARRRGRERDPAVLRPAGDPRPADVGGLAVRRERDRRRAGLDRRAPLRVAHAGRGVEAAMPTASPHARRVGDEQPAPVGCEREASAGSMLGRCDAPALGERGGVERVARRRRTHPRGRPCRRRARARAPVPVPPGPYARTRAGRRVERDERALRLVGVRARHVDGPAVRRERDPVGLERHAGRATAAAARSRRRPPRRPRRGSPLTVLEVPRQPQRRRRRARARARRTLSYSPIVDREGRVDARRRPGMRCTVPRGRRVPAAGRRPRSPSSTSPTSSVMLSGSPPTADTIGAAGSAGRRSSKSPRQQRARRRWWRSDSRPRRSTSTVVRRLGRRRRARTRPPAPAARARPRARRRSSPRAQIPRTAVLHAG